MLDRRNGYFRQIRNLVTGTEHKPPTDGVWPFGLWLGTRQEPRQKVVEITADSAHTVEHNFEGSSHAGALTLSYPDLVDNATRRGTGVQLTVRIRLQEK